jgi:hypothetical protein
MGTRVIPIAPGLHLLAQQAGSEVSIATALTPSALAVAMSAHSLYVEAGLADQPAEFVGDRLQAT